jgi:hypothetical protein
MESEVKHLPQALNTDGIDADQSLSLPGTEAYESLPQFPKRSALPFRRTIRRKEMRQIVPLAETPTRVCSRISSSRNTQTTSRCIDNRQSPLATASRLTVPAWGAGSANAKRCARH